MAKNADRMRFRNEDLLLKVNMAVERRTWDESRYESFLDELCGTREYQKAAIKTALRYMLGGQYDNLRSLARENFDNNETLHDRYGSWEGMQRHLQLPDQLSASLDLATATGKSYVLYGLASIMLAEGIVDSVLVLCPSTTIEAGLTVKFRELAGNVNLRDLLPDTSVIASPRIINASESIVQGCLCIENYHAVLERVGSSIRDSLAGKGRRVLVLNDEAHHVANEASTKIKKWKEFLTSTDYGFHYVIGVSGTCYVEDDYFTDVIFRFSLREAMEQQYVKDVDYVAETSHSVRADEKWQLIHSRHQDIKRKLASVSITPLTIIVTHSIQACKDVADDLKAFLLESKFSDRDSVDDEVLAVYNGAPDVRKLPSVDAPTSRVEWIVSVSMLNEGWDVRRVFQIVPHEERAFNSKLLIAQVLGRGLRLPVPWNGPQPQVVVFNHDAWGIRIRQLVNEILEREKRISSSIVLSSPMNFTLHNIDYTRETTTVRRPLGPSEPILAKGYIELASDTPTDQINTTFERASTGKQFERRDVVRHNTYTAEEVAAVMFQRLLDAYDPDDPDPNMHHDYTQDFTLESLTAIVSASLARCGMTVATESTKQRCLRELGALRRRQSENIQYDLKPNNLIELSTSRRPIEYVNAGELRYDKTYFFTDRTVDSIPDEQEEFYREATAPASGFKCYPIQNRLDLKSPLNAAIASSDPERRFITALLDPANLPHYDAWIKSTSTRFYPIEYAWKVGAASKVSTFNPDFFIKAGNLILVVEIKDDEELRNPSDENRQKNEAAVAHYSRINEYLSDQGSSIRYRFNFLTPSKYNTYFQYLREGRIDSFRSTLDLELMGS